MARSAQHPTLAWLTHDGLTDAEHEAHLQLGWQTVGTAAAAAASDPEGEGGESEAGAPAGNASREAWAAYALTQGATGADLDGLNRNDIRDAYGD